MNVWIVDAVRTPTGRRDGQFAHLNVQTLGSAVIRALYARTGVRPEEIVMGNAIGPGGNEARYAAIVADFVHDVPAMTVDLQCGAGLGAIRTAAALIGSGMRSVVYAGGMESSSTTGFFERASFSPETVGDPDMITAANNVAARYSVTKADCDAWAENSYARAFEAMRSGVFADECVAVDGGTADELGVTESRLARFVRRTPRVEGSESVVTAANAAGWTDGASAVMLVDDEVARTFGDRALRIAGWGMYAGSPTEPPLGAVGAVRDLFARTGVKAEEVDIWEVNEAFAVVPILVARTFDVCPTRMNRNGGAIAFGHPFGASGSIILTRLFYEMHRTGARRGVATIAVAGGQGLAVMVERG